jgi:hypothetical protein
MALSSNVNLSVHMILTHDPCDASVLVAVCPVPNNCVVWCGVLFVAWRGVWRANVRANVTNLALVTNKLEQH